METNNNFLVNLLTNKYDKQLEDLIESFLSKLTWKDVGDIYSCSLNGRSATYKDGILIEENSSEENEKRCNELRLIIINFFIGITPDGFDWFKCTFYEMTKNLKLKHYTRIINPSTDGLTLDDIISNYTIKRCDELAKQHGY